MNEMPGAMFLTEAGNGAGLGHLKRCVALATELEALGAKVRFAVAGDVERLAACDIGPPALSALQWTRASGLALRALADWRPGIVVVDSYAVTPRFLEELRVTGAYVVVIDDLADRVIPADMVVNGAYHASRLPYRGLPETVFLLGPRYALLDPAFGNQPPRRIRHPVGRVLVTLGGEGDAERPNEVVTIVGSVVPGATIDLVVGPFAAVPVSHGHQVHLHRGVSSLRMLLLNADIAVTGSGMTLYECLATGTPAVALCLADNQRPNFEEMARPGLIVQGEPDLKQAFEKLVGDLSLRETLSRRGKDVVDGGGALRVATALLHATHRTASQRGL
jgi:spore coat polysaccharide biosynthesis predicted glycosyltransferase SpsG